MREYLVLLSICETCKRRGLNFLDFLCSGETDIDRFARSRVTRYKPPQRQGPATVPALQAAEPGGTESTSECPPAKGPVEVGEDLHAPRRLGATEKEIDYLFVVRFLKYFFCIQRQNPIYTYNNIAASTVISVVGE